MKKFNELSNNEINIAIANHYNFSIPNGYPTDFDEVQCCIDGDYIIFNWADYFSDAITLASKEGFDLSFHVESDSMHVSSYIGDVEEIHIVYANDPCLVPLMICEALFIKYGIEV